MAEDYLYSELTHKIRGAIFAVYNELGYGPKEVVYQRALAIELQKWALSFVQEPFLNIIYANQKVGTYKPDFLVENKVIIEMVSAVISSKISGNLYLANTEETIERLRIKKKTPMSATA